MLEVPVSTGCRCCKEEHARPLETPGAAVRQRKFLLLPAPPLLGSGLLDIFLILDDTWFSYLYNRLIMPVLQDYCADVKSFIHLI